MKLTKEQQSSISDLMLEDKLYYIGTYDSNPLYEKFLQKTFGENWLDFHLDFWERCYDFEFEYDWYVYQVTGVMSEEMKEWVKEGLESLKEFQLQEQELE